MTDLNLSDLRVNTRIRANPLRLETRPATVDDLLAVLIKEGVLLSETRGWATLEERYVTEWRLASE